MDDDDDAANRKYTNYYVYAFIGLLARKYSHT